jgi:RecA/RadA recombinase
MGRPKKKLSVEAEQVIESIQEPQLKKEMKFISTGSTLLNLACSDRIDGGYLLGSIVHIVGDAHVGKSLVALTLMAEAVLRHEFDNYQLIYGEYEAAMNFPLENMFGQNINRVQFVPTDKDRLKGAVTAQDWHSYLLNLKTPYIHITDSLDAIIDEGELEDDRPTKGGWSTGKAKVSSALFPKIVGKIESSDSLEIVISQTRDNIGVMFGEKKTHSGGNAIKFYRSHSIWLAIGDRIYKMIRNKKREVGVHVTAKIKKNKVTGKVRQVTFPVYYDLGIDDVGSMIDWMVDEIFWGKEKNMINTANDFGLDSPISRDKLITYIEEYNLENTLRKVVGECWKELEDEISIKRKPRYI